MRTCTKQLLWLVLFLGIGVTGWAQNGTLSGRVLDEGGDPIIGGNVTVKQSRLGAVTDVDGNFKISIAPGSYTLLFTYLGFATIERNVEVVAGQTTPVEVRMEEDAIGLSDVVILGTRANNRLVIDSPVPVDVIDAKELRASGVTQTIQILQALIPSYNAPKQAISDGSDHFRVATLRGLGPDQVLVLVNGKRRHTNALVHVNGTVGRGSTGVDLNAIPASAIEKIEVLRDGAAAQYGSDAIAGVINIVLRKDYDLEISATGGMHMTTMERGYGATEGLNPGITNAAINDAYGFYNDDWLTNTENVNITDGEKLNLHVSKGFEIGDGGFVNISGQYRYQGLTNRQGLDSRFNYFTQADGSPDPREASFDRLNHRWGDSKFNDMSVFLNSELPLSSKTSAYLFSGYSSRDGESGCFYRRSRDNRTVRSIYPDGFLPLIAPTIRDFSVVGGIRGTLGSGWNWDLSQTVGNNQFELNMKNTHNTSLGGLRQFSFPAVTLADGTQETPEQKTEIYDGTLKFSQYTTNLDLSKPINMGGGIRSAVLSFGAEFRAETYGIDRGEISSYYNGNPVSGGIQDGPNQGAGASAGCQCFPGWKNTISASRNNVAAYGGLEMDMDKFTLDVAARFENYSDFGSTATGKVAARLELAEGVALRGAASTGFRAPSLAQGNYSAVQTTTFGTTLVETGFFPYEEGGAAEALGAEPLEAEKSTNFSTGLTVNSGRFALTLDGYLINVNNRIILSEQFGGAAITTYLNNLGIPAGAAVYFTNALNTRTTGLDITSRYAMDAGNGKLRFTFSANFNKTEITNKDDIQTPAKIKQFTDTPLLGQIEQTRLENGNPNNVFNLIVNYDINKFSVMLRGVRYGKITWADYNDFDDIVSQTYTPKVSTDLELAYQVTKGAQIAIGANNIFDVYPDKARKDLSFGGIFQYDGTYPIGFNGRFVYARAIFRM